jgi:hypothetical protein
MSGCWLYAVFHLSLLLIFLIVRISDCYILRDSHAHFMCPWVSLSKSIYLKKKKMQLDHRNSNPQTFQLERRPRKKKIK